MIDLSGKNILITGGSGFFGTAFCMYVKKHNLNPAKLAILSRDYTKQLILKEKVGDLPCMKGAGCWLTGDVRDLDRLKKAFNKIDIVIHAAAMKHIKNCQDEPEEAYLTNTVGAYNVVEAALYRKINKVLFISTDKAVEPITLYGLTKALAEGLILGGNKYKGTDDIRFSVCRYGNVIGSSGSVLPIWLKMIKEGAGYLPVTDERCTRFWYPVNDAIEFVLSSLETMRGGEVFIPRIKSIRITDLCKALYMPYKVAGLRCNEKIHEKMDINYDSEHNEFLTVEEIRETVKEVM